MPELLSSPGILKRVPEAAEGLCLNNSTLRKSVPCAPPSFILLQQSLQSSYRKSCFTVCCLLWCWGQAALCYSTLYKTVVVGSGCAPPCATPGCIKQWFFRLCLALRDSKLQVTFKLILRKGGLQPLGSLETTICQAPPIQHRQTYPWEK